MGLIKADKSVLLMIDFQTRLMAAIDRKDDVIANARRLAEAAKLLGVRTLYTEQNPKGLGGTVDELPARDSRNVIAKTSFDCAQSAEVRSKLTAGKDIVIAGVEAHICVLQTALGLSALGHKVFVVADACGSRKAENRQAGLARMADAGIEIVTTEMVLFEWIGDSTHEHFRQVSALVK
ncbi:MAG: hydrolase [Flavobacteriaceae bacterium]